MYNFGDIICFSNNNSEILRPYIVLYNENERIMCLLITQKIHLLKSRYFKITDLIFDNKKYSFIDTSNIIIKNIDDIVNVNMNLNNDDIDLLKKHIKLLSQKNSIYSYVNYKLENEKRLTLKKM